MMRLVGSDGSLLEMSIERHQLPYKSDWWPEARIHLVYPRG